MKQMPKVTAMFMAIVFIGGCQTSSLERAPVRCTTDEMQEYEALKHLALQGFLIGGLIGRQVVIQQHQPKYNELKEKCDA